MFIKKEDVVLIAVSWELRKKYNLQTKMANLYIMFNQINMIYYFKQNAVSYTVFLNHISVTSKIKTNIHKKKMQNNSKTFKHIYQTFFNSMIIINQCFLRCSLSSCLLKSINMDSLRTVSVCIMKCPNQMLRSWQNMLTSV